MTKNTYLVEHNRAYQYIFNKFWYSVNQEFHVPIHYILLFCKNNLCFINMMLNVAFSDFDRVCPLGRSEKEVLNLVEGESVTYATQWDYFYQSHVKCVTIFKVSLLHLEVHCMQGLHICMLHVLFKKVKFVQLPIKSVTFRNILFIQKCGVFLSIAQHHF